MLRYMILNPSSRVKIVSYSNLIFKKK